MKETHALYKRKMERKAAKRHTNQTTKYIHFSLLSNYFNSFKKAWAPSTISACSKE